MFFFFFQAEDGIRDLTVTGVQTCALPICVFTLLTPAAPHQRFWANGRSMLIVHTSIPGPSLPASWLNRRVSVSHTGVSSDGTELRRSTLPFASLRRTAWRLVSTAVTSGAGCPGLISGPTRVRGVPLKVTTPLRSSAMEVPSWSLGVRRDCPDSRRVYIVRYTAARESRDARGPADRRPRVVARPARGRAVERRHPVHDDVHAGLRAPRRAGADLRAPDRLHGQDGFGRHGPGACAGRARRGGRDALPRAVAGDAVPRGRPDDEPPARHVQRLPDRRARS